MSKTLQERITLAVKRITDGLAPMRIPVDETDPDIVLSVCSVRIAELESQLSALQADAQRMNWLEQQTVQVRKTLRYGSKDMFWATPDIEEEASNLRAQVDAALSVGQQPPEA